MGALVPKYRKQGTLFQGSVKAFNAIESNLPHRWTEGNFWGRKMVEEQCVLVRNACFSSWHPRQTTQIHGKHSRTYSACTCMNVIQNRVNKLTPDPWNHHLLANPFFASNPAPVHI